MSELIIKPIMQDGKQVGIEYHGELVRCKDCKYWRTNEDLHRCFVWCVYTVGNGFCYRAERGNNGETD